MITEKTSLPVSLTPEQYIEKRLDDQIEWMSNRSGQKQKIYKRLKGAQIVAAALIPFLTGYITEGDQAHIVKFIVGSLGALIAVCSGASSLGRFQELWIQYRSTAEALSQHRFLYSTRTAPYQGADAAPLLVQNVENLLAQERVNWVTSARDSAKEAEPNAGDAGDAEVTPLPADKPAGT